MLHDKDKYSQSKGIKPKNRVFCPDCGRQKMKFNTEKEAQSFIKWNRLNFDEKIPSRIYWCEACCGYHITARPMGNVGVTINMKLPYLTEALQTDRRRVITTVKMIYKVLNILKQPSGYYGKSGLGKCKSILDNLDYTKNPYYLEERKQLYEVVEQQRAEYKDVWMKRKYCRLIKTKLYRSLCDTEHDEDYVTGRYKYDLAYILHLSDVDDYDLNELPELFLEEWETLFSASSVSKYLAHKMENKEPFNNETDKNTQNEEALSETEESLPGIQVSD